MKDFSFQALKLGVMKLLCSFLETDGDDEEVATHVMLILGLLTDAGKYSNVC